MTFISHHSLIISWCCDISSSLICVLFLLTWSYFPNPHMHEEWLYERIWHDMIYYDITCSVMIWYHLSHFYRYRFLDRTLKEFDWRHIFFWIHLKSIQKMLNLIISDHLISNVPYLAICKIYLFSSLLFYFCLGICYLLYLTNFVVNYLNSCLIVERWLKKVLCWESGGILSGRKSRRVSYSLYFSLLVVAFPNLSLLFLYLFPCSTIRVTLMYAQCS